MSRRIEFKDIDNICQCPTPDMRGDNAACSRCKHYHLDEDEIIEYDKWLEEEELRLAGEGD